MDRAFEPRLFIRTKHREDEDISRTFPECIEREVKYLYDKFKYKKDMIITKSDKEAYEKATRSRICELKGEFEDDDTIVRDHCHLTGKFRDAAHKCCNLKYKVPQSTPEIFHNSAGYDAHFYIKNLGVAAGKIKCIPNNNEYLFL